MKGPAWLAPLSIVLLSASLGRQTAKPAAKPAAGPVAAALFADVTKAAKIDFVHDADASPLTIYGGGGGGGTPDADAELFELGREFDEAVAAHEQWEREEYGPFIRGREHAPASEIPGLSEMEDRRGELVDAYDEIAARNPERVRVLDAARSPAEILSLALDAVADLDSELS